MESKEAAALSAIEEIEQETSKPARLKTYLLVSTVVACLGFGVGAGMMAYGNLWGFVVAMAAIIPYLILSWRMRRQKGTRQALRQDPFEEPTMPWTTCAVLIVMPFMHLVPNGNALWSILFGALLAALMGLAVYWEEFQRAA